MWPNYVMTFGEFFIRCLSIYQAMKDSLVRSFNNFEPDVLKQSGRAEWPAMLHNLCYLHAAVQLRTRYGFGGWNCPSDFQHVGNFELQVRQKQCTQI